MTKKSPPLGIQVIAVLGILVAVISIVGEVAAVFGGVETGVGIVALVLSVTQVVVLLALIELKSWAWPAALALFTFGTGVRVVQGNVGSSIISILIAGYLYLQKPLFRGERIETAS